MDGMISTKLCKNCKFFRKVDNNPPHYYCCRPVKTETSLVTGTVEFRERYSTCEVERQDSEYFDRCGKEGKFWVNRESAMDKLSNFFQNFFRQND
jgi:hypothetical protein